MFSVMSMPMRSAGLFNGRRAVAGTEHDRVALYAAEGRRNQGETRVRAPTDVAVNGKFPVAYDSAAQRLMKFKVE